MVLHEGSINSHTSIMENTTENHTDIEFKNHTQTVKHKKLQIDETSWKTTYL